jgi:hypothetical protein
MYTSPNLSGSHRRTGRAPVRGPPAPDVGHRALSDVPVPVEPHGGRAACRLWLWPLGAAARVGGLGGDPPKKVPRLDIEAVSRIRVEVEQHMSARETYSYRPLLPDRLTVVHEETEWRLLLISRAILSVVNVSSVT